MTCIICGNKSSGAVCPRCGYDESQNREQYPTLADDGKRLRANAALRNELYFSVMNKNAAAKQAGSPLNCINTEKPTTRTSHASSIVAHGKCGDRLTWEIDGDGLLTVSGSGMMNDYNHAHKAPWGKYKSTIKEVKLGLAEKATVSQKIR